MFCHHHYFAMHGWRDCHAAASDSSWAQVLVAAAGLSHCCLLIAHCTSTFDDTACTRAQVCSGIRHSAAAGPHKQLCCVLLKHALAAVGSTQRCSRPTGVCLGPVSWPCSVLICVGLAAASVGHGIVRQGTGHLFSRPSVPACQKGLKFCQCLTFQQEQVNKKPGPQLNFQKMKDVGNPIHCRGTYPDGRSNHPG